MAVDTRRPVGKFPPQRVATVASPRTALHTLARPIVVPCHASDLSYEALRFCVGRGDDALGVEPTDVMDRMIDSDGEEEEAEDGVSDIPMESD